ncbi:hypothetical protein M8J76_000982 [Diaphorina citri]|nr:hypothetical protein M8J76_000982 [Diaphorina citri]
MTFTIKQTSSGDPGILVQLRRVISALVELSGHKYGNALFLELLNKTRLDFAKRLSITPHLWTFELDHLHLNLTDEGLGLTESILSVRRVFGSTTPRRCNDSKG